MLDTNIYSEVTPDIIQLAALSEKAGVIDSELFKKYDVKRGLRDVNGKGVLTGLTNISIVNATKVVDGKTVPAHGELYYRGYNVKDLSFGNLRNSIAMVLQKNTLFAGTIAENLRWGNENATLEEAKHACELAQAAEFIERFPDGYNTKIERGGTNVSGGQKQRLCIARALLKKPKILILDDSTSAVDTATDAKIRKAFREEIPNTTKLIIAQRISSVEDADHILVLNEGEVNGYGTHEELLKNNEIYRDIYELQKKGAEE
mgnify:CR=1 FL=1